tara:strand:+ start:820 stop:993 length:174 start_codon:yes stop_codon:yes gene_type:complete
VKFTDKSELNLSGDFESYKKLFLTNHIKESKLILHKNLKPLTKLLYNESLTELEKKL